MAVRYVRVSSLKQIDNYSKKSKKKKQPKIQQELTASRSNRKSPAACDVVSHTAVRISGSGHPRPAQEDEGKQKSMVSLQMGPGSDD